MLQPGLICKLPESFILRLLELFKPRVDGLSGSCLVQFSFRVYQLFLE